MYFRLCPATRRNTLQHYRSGLGTRSNVCFLCSRCDDVSLAMRRQAAEFPQPAVQRKQLWDNVIRPPAPCRQLANSNAFPLPTTIHEDVTSCGIVQIFPCLPPTAPSRFGQFLAPFAASPHSKSGFGLVSDLNQSRRRRSNPTAEQIAQSADRLEHQATEVRTSDRQLALWLLKEASRLRQCARALDIQHKRALRVVMSRLGNTRLDNPPTTQLMMDR